MHKLFGVVELVYIRLNLLDNEKFCHNLENLFYRPLILAGYLQDGRSGIPSRPRGPADISPRIDPSSLPVPVPV